MHNELQLRCRVCGVLNDDPPWGDDGNTPLFEYCRCCGVEHGYQDATPEGARKFRAVWIANGAVWHERKSKPKDWRFELQASFVPEQFM
jgi:hypothetical protein